VRQKGHRNPLLPEDFRNDGNEIEGRKRKGRRAILAKVTVLNKGHKGRTGQRKGSSIRCGWDYWKKKK